MVVVNYMNAKSRLERYRLSYFGSMTRLRGLYFITPSVGRQWAPTDLPRVVESAIQGGAKIVQWRQKPKPEELSEFSSLQRDWDARDRRPFLLSVAQEIREITRKYQVPFIVNDSVELALEIEADGVHMGQSDQALAIVQQRWQQRTGGERELIVGVTVRDALQAQVACEAGASYLGAGPVFASTTKPNANDGATIGVEGLRAATEAADRYNVPVFAIGGISAQDKRIQRCMEQGRAAGVAVVAAISDAEDIVLAAEVLCDQLARFDQRP